MFSDPLAWLTSGGRWAWSSQDADIDVQTPFSDLQLSLEANDGYYGWFEFTGPNRDPLTPGFYLQAERTTGATPDHPGIDISSGSRGCNTERDSFEVRDIAKDASGAVTRLWILYETRCEGGPLATWGELRFAEPVNDAPTQPTPSVMRWPGNNLGHARTTTPVTMNATAATQFTRATVSGRDAGDYTVDADQCSGQTLAAGAKCRIWIAFHPAAAGTRVANLHVAYSGSGVDIPLEGWSFGGTTNATFHSDPGDFIGKGQDWSFDAEDFIYAFANNQPHDDNINQHVTLNVEGLDGGDFLASFAAPDGQALTPGTTYTNVSSYHANAPGPTMTIGGNGSGCNWITGNFTVNDIAFDYTGTPTRASISFEQHCEGATPALHGMINLRIDDHAVPAPWMGGPPLSNDDDGGGHGGDDDGGGSGAGGSGGSGGGSAEASAPVAATTAVSEASLYSPDPGYITSQPPAPTPASPGLTVARHGLLRDLAGLRRAVDSLGSRGAYRTLLAARRRLQADLARVRGVRGIRGTYRLSQALGRLDTLVTRSRHRLDPQTRLALRRTIVAIRHAGNLLHA